MNRQYPPWIVSLLVVALFAAALFGLAGFRTILTIGIVFVVAPLMLLMHTNLDVEEKIFFSLFLGLGLFPLLVWLVDQALPSFRVSIAVALALAVAAGLFGPRILRLLHRKQQ